MSGETILIADDDGAIRTVLSQALSRHGYAVRAEPTAAGVWQWVAAGEGDLVISDVLLPDESGFDLIARIKLARPELPIVVMSAQNTILTAIGAAERGAFDYLSKPFDLKHLIALVQRALAKPKPMSPGPSASEERLPLIGRSPAMQDIYRSIARLTQTDLTVMIVGESGTGKELVARALHDFGKRRNGPFVTVNMAALPKELVESELFGHERGASTGVTGRGIGCFEQAEGGTLFLDEIGDMPMEAQTRLLRVLQEREYSGVGGRERQKTNVRIVAASNRDPRRLVHQGLLREDLFYRLSVVPLRLSPLRERREDIPDLARHFLRRAEKEGLPAKNFDPAALERLSRYRWPGNVRELENLVRRLVALEAGEMISAEAVSAEFREQDAEDSDMADSLRSAVEKHLGRYLAGFGAELPPPGLYGRVLEEIERPLIALCLAATSGNQIRAAQLLGLNRNTLRKKMREMGLRGRS